MRLDKLLRTAGVDAPVRGDGSTEISGLAYNSRQVQPGDLFFCVTGENSDGHDFAAGARRRGAVALVVERPLGSGTEVVVPDARAAMAPLAAAFWGEPSTELQIVGITGTNGKTTTAFLVRAILEADGTACGLLGTVIEVVGGMVSDAVRTTPEAIDLQRTFRRMLDRGDRACAMEVSSHALVLGRADRIRFAVRVFTNLTPEHQDFHPGMEDYFEAKRLLFLGEGGTAVVNVDDPYGRRLAKEFVGGELVSFSASGADADLRAKQVSFDHGGSRFHCVAPEGEVEVTTRLPGRFNVENALGALAVTRVLGVPLDRGAQALAGAAGVPGRFEPIDEGQPYGVLVDYAHTPDSLRNALDAARELTGGKLLAVFGCGGDRDRTKRPLMGEIGAERSDLAIVTSDNPRSEAPGAIIAEILAGIDPAAGEVIVEPNRRAAISQALASAVAGDLVVIAGKGHEQGQEFENGRKEPFDDRDVARDELRRLAAGGSR